MKKQSVYVIAGPTATGKTALAVALANEIGGEIVSADSMQIYRGMDIGTAKPTVQERQGIPHRMIDIIAPDEEYSVALYHKQANACIAESLSRGAMPIVVGGTGLYVNALTYDLDFTQTKQDRALRTELEQWDTGKLFELLKRKNPEAAKRIHPNNRRRVIRAIEIALGEREDKEYDFSKVNETYDFKLIGLTCERAVLYDRINARVDGMISSGLMEEAQRLYETYGPEPVSMQAIGYKEWRPLFEGIGMIEAEVLDDIKRNTRRFSKRQMTWFKRDNRFRWYDCGMTTAELTQSILRDFKEQ